MTPDEGRKYISAIFRKYRNIGTINFFGGEPTLAGDTIRAICEYIQSLYDSGTIDILPGYSIVTNGTLIDDKIAKIIMDFGIEITLGVDGPKHINDQLRIHNNGAGTYDDIQESLAVLRRYGIVPKAAEVTYTSIHRDENLSYLDIHRIIVKELGIPISMIIPCVSHDGVRNVFVVEKNSYAQMASQITSLYDSFDALYDYNSFLYTYLGMFVNLIDEKYSDCMCTAGYDSMAIFPDGSLYPCHMYGINKDFCIGEVI